MSSLFFLSFFVSKLQKKKIRDNHFHNITYQKVNTARGIFDLQKLVQYIKIM